MPDNVHAYLVGGPADGQRHVAPRQQSQLKVPVLRANPLTDPGYDEALYRRIGYRLPDGGEIFAYESTKHWATLTPPTPPCCCCRCGCGCRPKCLCGYQHKVGCPLA